MGILRYQSDLAGIVRAEPVLCCSAQSSGRRQYDGSQAAITPDHGLVTRTIWGLSGVGRTPRTTTV